MTLFQRRQCIVPTWRGWLVILLAGGALCAGLMLGVYPFLAVTEVRPGGVLVSEGWGSEAVMTDVLAEFRRNHYERLCVTGVPIEKSSPLAEFHSYAELGARTLIRLGGDPNTIHAVPAEAVKQDRTYASAVALKIWMREHGVTPSVVNVISSGAHARRTRLMFQKAFGNGVVVGIVACPERDFDPGRWWTSSTGFRTVTGEVIAYLYARFVFRGVER